MFCTKCGTQLNDDARFCTKCGAPTEAPAAAPTANGAPSPAATGAAAHAAQDAAASMLNAAESFGREKIAVIALAAIATILAFFKLVTSPIGIANNLSLLLTGASYPECTALEIFSGLDSLNGLMGTFSSFTGSDSSGSGALISGLKIFLQISWFIAVATPIIAIVREISGKNFIDSMSLFIFAIVGMIGFWVILAFAQYLVMSSMDMGGFIPMPTIWLLFQMAALIGGAALSYKSKQQA